MNILWVVLCLWGASLVWGQKTEFTITTWKAEAPEAYREVANKIPSHVLDGLIKGRAPFPGVNVLTMETVETLLKENGRPHLLDECSEKSCIVDIGRTMSVDYMVSATLDLANGYWDCRLRLWRMDGGDAKFIETVKISRQDTDSLYVKIEQAAQRLLTQLMNELEMSRRGGISMVLGNASGILLKKRFIAHIESEPSGAFVVLNGGVNPSCPKTPCQVELDSGAYRLTWTLDQYEAQDHSFVLQSNLQSIKGQLKPAFGVLKLAPQWPASARYWNSNVTKEFRMRISGGTYKNKEIQAGEHRLNPGQYQVKIEHPCLSSVQFDVRMVKGETLVFDKELQAATAGLQLSANKGGVPQSVVVYVNGQRVGETPWSGTLGVCSELLVTQDKKPVVLQLTEGKLFSHVHEIATVEYGTLTDSRDGKTYKTVVIGKQTLMAENLNYGTMVSGKKDQKNDSKVEKYCYNNKEYNCTTDGGLYQWAEAMALPSTCNSAPCASQISTGHHQGICPTGWHVPKKAEWDQLANYLGGASVAGKTMKLNNTGNSDWDATTNNDGNSSGFSALPAGGRYYGGGFRYRGFNAYFWEASESYASRASNRYLYYGNANLYADSNYETSGFSVRCFRD